MEIVLQQGCLILEHKGVGKNEMSIINMPKKKCALRKGVSKWPIPEESVANWVLKNRRQNKLIVTRNSVRLFVLKCISNCLDGTEDDYEESNSDGENDTDFDDVPEDINGRRICRPFHIIQY
ncbi:hypothetical protein TNCV_4605011 [Trichonephila clavipes]|nr:hypothetical protein TNCV_4605011 [Trichonephila clavipes]